MGEEWGAQQPFPFFCDFGGDLARAGCAGRRAEFAHFPEFADPKQRGRIPDPLAEATFKSAKLDWDHLDVSHLTRYRALLSVRKREIAPMLKKIKRGGTAAVYGDGAVQVRWQVDLDEVLVLSANLSERRVEIPSVSGRTLWAEGDAGAALGPWSIWWSVETPL